VLLRPEADPLPLATVPSLPRRNAMPLPSKWSWWIARGAGLVLLALLAGPAGAQVPQNTTFTGRLVDGAGNPMGGPVTMDLWI
jgi:hypothetical protein